jgi:hypothetical protein
MKARTSSKIKSIRFPAPLVAAACFGIAIVVRHAFEHAGVDFIDENVGGAGVLLRKSEKEKSRK